jgi:hypothetical protein
MLDTNLKAQLKAYLERLVMPIELAASLDDRESRRASSRSCWARSRPCRTRSPSWPATTTRASQLRDPPPAPTSP